MQAIYIFVQSELWRLMGRASFARSKFKEYFKQKIGNICILSEAIIEYLC
jgi:hypothetical protein